jgi:1-phosphatidylinositol phosphodiesterase
MLHQMTRYILFLIINTLFVLSTTAQSQTDDAWMRNIPDTTLLCNLSIPGTHDSGALDGGEAFQTQDVSIEEQLQMGIRCFDIRLKACENNLLGVYHSIVFQDAYWETDVLPTFISFLKSHPSETLIVMLKKEGGDGQEFARLLSQSLNDTLHSKFFIPNFKRDMNLGECRGKILFIHRDQLLENFPGAQCHGWKDNATCRITLKDAQGNTTDLSVEDEYQFEALESAPEKLATIWRHLTSIQHHNNPPHLWHITYASATALPEAGPQAFATIVNAQLVKFQQEHPQQTYGIVLIDFSGTTEGRTCISNIIRANKKEKTPQTY